MKKRFLPLVLALGLSLALALPAPAAEEAPQQTYEQAVAKLQNPNLYSMEATLDTDLCTVFLYRRIGIPHISYNRLTIIYKAGAPQGEGTAVDVHLREDNAFLGTTLSPDTIELSEDEKSLTYTYFFPEYGMDTYTVDLSTGEASVIRVPPTQEQLIDWFVDEKTAVESRLESPHNTVILWCSTIERQGTQAKDYYLYLFSKEPEKSTPETWFRRLVLPSTAVVGSDYPQYPTDRAPDALFLNEDGSVLTYVYSFEDALFNVDGELLHDVGTYTYTVDTATGELAVTHEKDTALPSSTLGAERTIFVDVSPEDWFAPYVKVCAEKGLLNGVGDGAFNPTGILNGDEALVMAARVLLQANGETEFPKGPDAQGFWAWAGQDNAQKYPFGNSVEETQWYVDSWCWDPLFYLAQAAGPELFSKGGITYSTDRRTFFKALAFATQALELPTINEVESVPDTRDEDILRLYRAGILSGTDLYGSFSAQQGLTRAEAAAALARIADPSLRVRFTLKEYPYQSYTLTYLMDGAPDCGITYPVCLLGEKGIMLTLDGQQLPWPAEGGVPSFALNPSGDYCYMGYWDESTDDPWDTKAGLIDRNGVYIVPPENGRKTTYAVDGGFFTEIYRESGTVWELLDEEGQFVRELEQIGDDPWVAYPPKGRNPLRGIEDFYNTHGQFAEGHYVDDTGLPISQKFDWAGHITDDGQGFVGMDKKIYRIQFEK